MQHDPSNIAADWAQGLCLIIVKCGCYYCYQKSLSIRQAQGYTFDSDDLIWLYNKPLRQELVSHFTGKTEDQRGEPICPSHWGLVMEPDFEPGPSGCWAWNLHVLQTGQYQVLQSPLHFFPRALTCFHCSHSICWKRAREVRHFARLSSFAITSLFLGLSPQFLESQRLHRNEGKCQEYYICNWVKPEENH